VGCHRWAVGIGLSGLAEPAARRRAGAEIGLMVALPPDPAVLVASHRAPGPPGQTCLATLQLLFQWGPPAYPPPAFTGGAAVSVAMAARCRRLRLGLLDLLRDRRRA